MKLSSSDLNQLSKRPNLLTDIEPSDGYLDSKEFQQYCAAIKKIVYANPQGVWIAGINRALGASVRRDWTMDAIRCLEAAGEVLELDKTPLQYVPHKRREPQVRRYSYNNGSSMPSDKTVCFAILDGGKKDHRSY